VSGDADTQPTLSTAGGGEWTCAAALHTQGCGSDLSVKGSREGMGVAGGGAVGRVMH